MEIDDGRHRVKEAPYLLPKDFHEVNRLDFQHYMLHYALQSNFAAPCEQPQHILDVGCGTGRWVSEMAQQFPDADVIGIDIEPPTLSGKLLKNVKFVQGNILQGLPFPDRSFDYVHQRLLFFGIPSTKWMPVIQDLIRITRVGGWVELVEADASLGNGGQVGKELFQYMIQTATSRGIDPSLSSHIADFLSQGGLKNVNMKTVNIPIGHRGGRLGMMALANLESLSEMMRPLVKGSSGMSDEVYNLKMSQVRKEWEINRSTLPYHFAYGQRID